MRASVYYGPRDIRVDTVPDPRIEDAGDAVVRITRACICGSDLWSYRGEETYEPGWRTGHEWLGVVEEVGAEVSTLRPGDYVIAPFAFSDGECEFCRAGLYTSCVHGGFWGAESGDGGQAEAIRARFADATLIKLPEAVKGDDELLARVLPLTDVVGTGHHAAVSARVTAGSTAVVIGDGAVGLCAVLAAHRLGAAEVILLGHHSDRLPFARAFGATDIVDSTAGDTVQRLREMTRGGAASVMECVGAQSSMQLACQITRPGGAIGYVGVPHGSDAGIDLGRLFADNIELRGGVAPVRAYLPELLAATLAGELDASPILDKVVHIDDVAEGYAAMDQRQAIKVMIKT